ncbi:vegetative protein [Neisseria bacilliformis ATCC BAA-1200]|uniref:Vegetative protein n=1 Tax=Neisseria bacilliformis ATCC BAA-1200 TaxID=888742 RepID=F2BA00_9NEIS|nr:vegetative protein [Neisseria bacilliformis ATCC BAA-1200]
MALRMNGFNRPSENRGGTSGTVPAGKKNALGKEGANTERIHKNKRFPAAGKTACTKGLRA